MVFNTSNLAFIVNTNIQFTSIGIGKTTNPF
jgi:hypothetical protein